MNKVTAIVDKSKCHPNLCQHECMTYDPINRSGGEGFHIGESGKSEIDESLVTEMHKISAKMCPFSAIKIVKLPEELKEKALHSYGNNQFRLYGLPMPMFGKVVGVLGVNGIGKSTAIKILAGVLKPNFGEEREASYEELIKHFKGTELQSFFEKSKKGEIKVAYKPQQVDLIPKQVKGKVKTLLKKVDDAGKFDEIVEKLELKRVLGHDVGDLSGGELQRVAIAATVLKKANVYIFDEPTSYLDIKQRINVSKFIRELADENTAVLVVEHDLIILDYMTDLVHLMYGQESCYGIISQPRSTRVGINVYLEGYLREENIRFRDHKIKFMKLQAKKLTKGNELISWKGIKKKVGSFNLEADVGVLNKHDSVGILGENGIGKTTFVRILADVIKLDKGKIKGKVKVSYKPQYLTVSKKIVAEVLKEAIKKYDVELIRPLNLKQLFDRKIDELSGGELQKVAIALCLSKKADMYLLDEPSAYLDVEQRLHVARMIKNIMEKRGSSALVVDHDILFIDYLSNNLLVFQGESAVNGNVNGTFSMEEGMNVFLKELNISLRRDKESSRPRINKLDSVLDREQKRKNKLYYA